jgi:uncharacterized protein YneF (UPF0154 family)
MKLNIKDWKVWLVRSTFGITREDNLPKNLCAFFWMFVLSIVTFPICYTSHVYNIIHDKTRPEMHAGIGFGLKFFSMAITLHILKSNNLSSDLLYVYLLSPITLLIVLIGFALFGGLAFGIISVFDLFYKLFKTNIKDNKNIKPSMLSEYVTSRKNKYCKTIEYEN